MRWNDERISNLRTAGVFYSVAELEVAKDGIFVGIIRQLLMDAFPDTAAEAMFVYRCELKDGTMLRAAQYRYGRCRRQDCFVEVATADELAGDNWMGKIEIFVVLSPTLHAPPELFAVVQPLTATASWLQQLACPAGEEWTKMAMWKEAGQLLPFASYFSRAATEGNALQLCHIAAIIGKVCILDSPARDDMMMVRVQNKVDEL